MTRVSVVIPVFGTTHLLPEAIASIEPADGVDIELVIVDDGNDPAIARDLPGNATSAFAAVTTVRQDHRGAAAARNAGVDASGGEVLMFLDADDLWEPAKVTTQVRSVADEPGRLHTGWAQEFLDPHADWTAGPVPRARLLTGPSIITLACTRTTFDEVGPLRADLRAGETIDWLLRARRMGIETVTLPAVLARRRAHPGNRDRRERAESADYLRVIREHRAASEPR